MTPHQSVICAQNLDTGIWCHHDTLVFTIAKGSTVGPLGWSVNGSNLPGQADSRQGITTGLAGETGHRCSYIL